MEQFFLNISSKNIIVKEGVSFDKLKPSMVYYLIVRLVVNLQLFLKFLIISLAIFALDYFKVLATLETIFYQATNPIQYGLYSSGSTFSRKFHSLTTLKTTVDENQALKQKLTDLYSENANLKRQLNETQALLDQQASLDPKIFKLLPARPIGKNRYLQIDKGSNDGVKVNQAVVFKDNLIGQVISFSEKGAKIKLLTDPDTKLAALSQNVKGKAKGVMIGQFGSEMLFDKILHQESLSVGDLVYSDGSESVLPRGLILGRVTQVLDQPTQVFKQAKVKPIFDLRDLEVVFLILE